MRKVFRALAILIMLTIVLFSPLSVYNFISRAKNIAFNKRYVKKKIKLDSMIVESFNGGDGNIASGYYKMHNEQYHLEFSFTDNEQYLLNGLIDDNIIPDMMMYMENHHDSIWIWYHSNAAIKYAREADTDVPIREDLIYLLINGSFIIIAIFQIRWQIKYYKRKKLRRNK